ncbi:MAG TPA: branched-chain amino acid transaminase [Polyangiaceae bacterium]|nr:branched-chain amino acid transaminase [Polyangiaceae bacterium]
MSSTHISEWPGFHRTPEFDELPLSRPKGQTLAPYIWWDGAIREASGQAVHYFSNALHYGSGVFEGIRCYPTPNGPALFRLHDHFERLLASAAVYGMSIRYSPDALAQATVEIVRKNGIENGYMRPLAFFGQGSVALAPKKECAVHVFIAARELGAYLGEEGLRRGIRVTISSWRKFHHTMLPTTAKASGHYANSVLAAHEALDRGFDDAILLNQDGTVAEATGENVFFVKGKELVTNDATSSILPGLTRDTVLKLAAEANIPVRIRAFTRDELMSADEVFLTGTAAEVTPVREIDGRKFRTGPSTLGAKLQKAYLAVVCGRDDRHAHWLTSVHLASA